MWQVNFPKMMDVATKTEVMVLSAEAIDPGPGRSVTHALAHCIAQDGNTHRLIVELAQLAAAPRIHLVEAGDLRAAPGLIVDFSKAGS